MQDSVDLTRPQFAFLGTPTRVKHDTHRRFSRWHNHFQAQGPKVEGSTYVGRLPTLPILARRSALLLGRSHQGPSQSEGYPGLMHACSTPALLLAYPRFWHALQKTTHGGHSGKLSQRTIPFSSSTQPLKGRRYQCNGGPSPLQHSDFL